MLVYIYNDDMTRGVQVDEKEYGGFPLLRFMFEANFDPTRPARSKQAYHELRIKLAGQVVALENPSVVIGSLNAFVLYFFGVCCLT